MRITVAADYANFKMLGRGAVLPSIRRVKGNRVIANYVRWCVACDRKSIIPIGGKQGFTVQGDPFLVGSLTLNGILECPGCGWRGRIIRGQYVKEEVP